ncbi:13398_t:CDS:1, partial [Gigaspora rosea]
TPITNDLLLHLEQTVCSTWINWFWSHPIYGCTCCKRPSAFSSTIQYYVRIFVVPFATIRLISRLFPVSSVINHSFLLLSSKIFVFTGI